MVWEQSDNLDVCIGMSSILILISPFGQRTILWIYGDDRVLSTITRRPNTPPEALISLPVRLKTPVTVKSMRQLKLVYIQDPGQDKVDLLFKANERLAAQHAIDELTKKGLLEAIDVEKKKRKRGKRLNLVGEENSGPQFFSPTRIQAARAYQEEKAALEQAENASKEVQKALNIEKRAREDAAKVEARLQRQVVRDIQEQIKAEERALRELKKQDKSKAIAQKSVPKTKPTKGSKVAHNASFP